MKYNKTAKNNRYSKRKSNNNSSLFWWLIIGGSLFFTYRNNPQLVNNFTEEFLPNLSNISLVSTRIIRDEFITKINETDITAGSISSLQKNKFAEIDNKALSVQYSGTSVKELADILSQLATTEEEKARIIYRWITHNIAYDVVSLNRFTNENIYPNVTAENVLVTRQTICSGYANLYQKLANNMGLKSLIVVGYAKGSTDFVVGDDNTANHAWNGVKINGNWYLVDTTWGAGIVNDNRFERRFNNFYFATNPQHFIYTHFPEDGRWQLLPNPYTRAHFDALPNVQGNFFENNLELVSHTQKSINAGGNVNITIKAPSTVEAIASLKSAGQNLPDNYTLVQRQGEFLNVMTSFPQQGNYQLEIFAKPKSDSGDTFPLVLSYEVTANQEGKTFPTIYRHFSQNNGYLETPTMGDLYPNQANYFKLRVDNATEVRILDKSTNRWSDLTRYGNLYTGNVNISSGDVVVFAKFPGDSRYWALLEYQTL
ncbi:MAG: transglutaminase [Cyanobacterium sp. T60_A2020_053]|nr:transglutaminase [Cyanobacterium sp. T60_A2020_053]